MTSPCHVPDTSLDPFDTLDEPMDDAENEWYADQDDPFCPFHNGDAEGLCIKAKYGCHYEGCDKATPNG